MYHILIHGNYDYSEFMESRRTPKEAINCLADMFELEIEEFTTGKAFSQALDDQYQGRDWKGIAVTAIDGETGKLHAIKIDALFDCLKSAHAQLDWEAKLRTIFSKSKNYTV